VTIASLLAAATAAHAFTAGAAAPPRPALAALPSRVELAGRARAEVRVRSQSGSERVDVSLAPYALDLRGRPRLHGPYRPPAWISVRPRTLRVDRRGAIVTVVARPPRGAPPGDHPFALVLTTRPSGRGVAVRLRVGVLVTARVPGRVVRRLVVGPLSVRRTGRVRMLELAVRNAGNVTERIAPGRVVLAVVVHGRVVARLHGPARSFLPRSRGVVGFAYRGAARGPATVVVGLGAFLHTYPLRL